MSTDSCPSAEILNDWAQGRLDQRGAQTVEAHLDICRKCEQLSADFQLLKPSQISPDKNGYHTEEECNAAIDRVVQNKDKAAPTVRPWDTLTGAKIRDYQLIRQLGKGGMGTVYLAEHTRLKKRVAIKVLPYRAVEDPSNVKRFRREMRAVGQLDHANVVQALDAGEDGGLYFLTMELITGQDLSDLTKGKRRFSVEESCEIIRQAAEGLQYVHDQGLIHRDIKPSNIMLTEKDVQVKVLDLGLALLPDSGSIDTAVTSESLLVGTLEYMSPEQTETTEGLDHRIDIYSLGITLFRLLTGTIPFRGGEFRKPMKRLKALTTIDPPSVATRRNNLPPKLVALVDQMIARIPAARPESMTEIAERLREFCPKSPLSEIPTGHIDSVELDDADFSNAKALLNADTSPTACDTVVDRSQLGDTHVFSRSQTSKWIALFLIPVAMICGIAWLQTNGAYVQVESDSSTQLTIDVLDSTNAPITSFEIGEGQSSFWLKTGSYKLRIPAKHKEISLSRDRLDIERGDRPVVVIEQQMPAQKKTSVNAETLQNVLAANNKLPVARSGWKWSSPANLGETINTEWKDDQPAFSDDGLTMFFGSYCIPRCSGEGDRDLWMATRKKTSEPWGNVQNLGATVNSAMKETHPTYHSPTRTLIFASNRGGGNGEVDMWFTTLAQDGQSWSRPANLGPRANSGFVDESPDISRDGLTLYFSSTRPAQTAGHNIWMCTRESVTARWKIPKEVPNVCSVSDDSDPTVSSDQLTLVFASKRNGGAGKQDLWASTRASIDEDWSEPFNLGSPINTPETDSQPVFSPVDNRLYFGSARADGFGGTDLWSSQRLGTE